MIPKDERGQYLCKHVKQNVLDVNCVWCSLTVAELGLKTQRERVGIYEKALKELSVLGGGRSEGNSIAQRALEETKFKPSEVCSCSEPIHSNEGGVDVCKKCEKEIPHSGMCNCGFHPLEEIKKIYLHYPMTLKEQQELENKINELVDEINKLKVNKNDN